MLRGSRGFLKRRDSSIGDQYANYNTLRQVNTTTLPRRVYVIQLIELGKSLGSTRLQEGPKMEQQSKSTRYNLRARETTLADKERRTGPRLNLTASAEVIEVASAMRISGRTTDIGPGGCFIDTLLPLAAGSEVRVRIRKGESDFVMSGIVVYAQKGLGMGIAFTDGPGQQPLSFDTWAQDIIPSHKIGSEAASQPTQLLTNLSIASGLVELVHLLVAKGVLTEREAASIGRKVIGSQTDTTP